MAGSLQSPGKSSVMGTNVNITDVSRYTRLYFINILRAEQLI